MDNFLSNSHYQQYGGRDINYRHFICKDCSKKKKEYEPGQETDELPKNKQVLATSSASGKRFKAEFVFEN